MQLYFFWPAIGVATLVGMLIPAVWFAPKVLGKAWQQLCGLSDAQLADPWPRLGLALACSFINALALAGFMNFTGSTGFLQGSLLGAQLGLAFMATALGVDYVFAQRPLKLLFIVLAPNLLSLLFMGGLLAAWKR